MNILAYQGLKYYSKPSENLEKSSRRIKIFISRSIPKNFIKQKTGFE